MHKKLSRLIEPNLQPYLLCLALFAALTAPIQPLLALAEAAALAGLYVYHRRQSLRRRRSVMQYIESITGGTDSISKNSMLNTPLPVVVFRGDNGEVVWANQGFSALSEAPDDVFSMRIEDLAPDFDYRWLLDGNTGEELEELTEIGGRTYRVYGNASRASGRASSQDQIVTAYFVDVTESRHIQALYESSRPVTCLLVVDNYEELLKAGGEAAKSAVLAQIDERLNAWTTGSGGLLLKYTRDRYLFLCDESWFQHMTEDKFSVLESIHQVTSEDGVTASLSIGVGKDCESYEEGFQWAEKSIEMALSRGGDQAVVKDSLDFQFYGGRSKSTEKRTKVKSRVMANALGELIADAGQVYVMGHEYADMDAVGAAAGICCAARKKGKKAQIVIDMEGNNARPLVRKLRELPEYEDVFVTGPDAFIHAQPGALLVVVDTNRPDMVENRQLLDACNRVAVIDHHRRAATYIENAALNFHEPYASSASELVTELLQYLVEPSDMLRGEAEALLAGIVLDVEPYTLDQWDENPGKVMDSYVSGMKRAYALAQEYDLEVIACVPWHYDNKGLTAGLEELIQYGCDSVAVMNYYRGSEVQNIAAEAALARKHGKGIITIYELQKADGRGILEVNTYYQSGLKALEESYISVKQAYPDQPVSIAYHDYKALREVLNR